jgi:hypothetical protein
MSSTLDVCGYNDAMLLLVVYCVSCQVLDVKIHSEWSIEIERKLSINLTYIISESETEEDRQRDRKRETKKWRQRDKKKRRKRERLATN